MEYSLENANEFISINAKKVNKSYRLKFHMMPPIGWMNDPNGLIKYKEQYHIFYQYYPYDSKWGPMHWGHFVTKDLIEYKDYPVALAPENQALESGCFSGGAISVDDQLMLVYTRHLEKENEKKEDIFAAISEDGIQFEKIDQKLFETLDLPEEFSRTDFRDPYPVKINNMYYIFIGGKSIVTNEGVILVLKSNSLKHFTYDFSIGPFYELGDMGECPSYHRVGDRDVILVSGCSVKEKNNSFKNVNSSVFLIGKIDFEKKKMDIDEIKEIDKGDTFYAPQFISEEDKPIMVGWLEMWGKRYPTHEWDHGYVGALTFPRELIWKNNTIYQRPIEGLKKYYQAQYKYNGQLINCSCDIEAFIDGSFQIKFQAINGNFIIGQEDKGVYLDTRLSNNLNGCIRYTTEHYQHATIRILLDQSSIELFIDDGKEVISSRVYLDQGYTLEVIGNVSNIWIKEVKG